MAEPVTVSFDLDGVVMKNPFEKGVLPHILRHLRRSPALCTLPEEEADRRANTAIREAWGRHAAAGEFVSCYDWDAIYQEVSHRFGGEPTPDVSQLVRTYCGVEGTIWLLPGARSGLERLNAAGLRVVAVTNGYHAYQWPVLEALGVSHLFAAVYTPEAVGYAKPDPRLFRKVPGLAAHVGDNLIHDVLGANLAGVRSVWLKHELPGALAARPLHDRTQAPEFAEYLSAALQASPYLQYHPEATFERAGPDAVVCDVDEAATVLLDWYA